MKNLNQLIQQEVSGLTSKPTSEQERTPEEKQATNYLFGLLSVVFGEKKMSVTFPDEMLIAAKRMNATAIGKFSREEIDKGIVFIKEQRANANSDFDWPNLDLIIGAIRDANRVRALHREYEPPAALIGHDKSVAEEAGRKALDEMKALFS
jgi:hypothetical protein